MQEIFIPGEDVIRVKNGRKRKQHVVYFPGYVMLNMELGDDEKGRALWHLLMDLPYVSGFVGGTREEPRPLGEKDLRAIQKQLDSGMREQTQEDEFEVGQDVIVIDGPFANFKGKVDLVNLEKNQLRVMISILGRSTPVELGFDKVKQQATTS